MLDPLSLLCLMIIFVCTSVVIAKVLKDDIEVMFKLNLENFKEAMEMKTEMVSVTPKPEGEIVFEFLNKVTMSELVLDRKGLFISGCYDVEHPAHKSHMQEALSWLHQDTERLLGRAQGTKRRDRLRENLNSIISEQKKFQNN